MKLNLKNLDTLIKDGYISQRWHESAPYQILNYTAKCQYEKGMWNETTLQCRGLILDKDNNVIAKPFSKFFNYEEYGEGSNLGTLPKYNSFEVFDKLDGSLGILYRMPDGEFRIATRGSFESEQAKVGTEILKANYKNPELIFADNYTYLFEIIYPENRIVVDYGGKKDLILLTAINIPSGEEFNISDFLRINIEGGVPIVKRYDGIKDFTTIKKDLSEPNAEGFVIRFDTGLRIKLKFEEYVRLHRLITGVNNKAIWDLLRNGESVDELLDRVPDEFYNWVKKTKEELEKEYSMIALYCKVCLSNIATLEWAEEEGIIKETAEQIKKSKYPSVIFAMWRNKEYKDVIWKLIKPEYSKPFKESI